MVIIKQLQYWRQSLDVIWSNNSTKTSDGYLLGSKCNQKKSTLQTTGSKDTSILEETW